MGKWNYNGLWKLLIDRDMTKENLRESLKFSASTISKMGRGERVSLEVIEKICDYLGCRPGDIMDYISDEK